MFFQGFSLSLEHVTDGVDCQRKAFIVLDKLCSFLNSMIPSVGMDDGLAMGCVRTVSCLEVGLRIPKPL